MKLKYLLVFIILLILLPYNRTQGQVYFNFGYNFGSLNDQEYFQEMQKEMGFQFGLFYTHSFGSNRENRMYLENIFQINSFNAGLGSNISLAQWNLLYSREILEDLSLLSGFSWGNIRSSTFSHVGVFDNKIPSRSYGLILGLHYNFGEWIGLWMRYTYGLNPLVNYYQIGNYGDITEVSIGRLRSIGIGLNFKLLKILPNE